jgi:hypothetical protein
MQWGHAIGRLYLWCCSITFEGEMGGFGRIWGGFGEVAGRKLNA